MGFPGGRGVKNPSANAGDTDLIHGLGRSPGVENGNSLQYSCLEHPIDIGAYIGRIQSIGMQRVRHD